MISKIDHIAIAVKDLEGALENFRTILGSPEQPIHTEEVPSENVRIAFIPIGETTIELLQPLSPTGAIANFLEKNGDGLHHIAIETDNIEAEHLRLTELGKTPLSPPKEGGNGKTIMFLHPKTTNRVLLEFTHHPLQPPTTT